MISPRYFVESLKSVQMDFFAGVPDSLLKNICAYITDHSSADHNIIAANEGAAVGLAAGYYLSTGKTPVVYMQNSGLGNIVNPLMSLTDKEVYNIPMLLLIGWRGEPGVKDEPQHVKQGKVTLSLLDAMGIRYTVLSQIEAEMLLQINAAKSYMDETKESFAFVIQKGTFSDYNLNNQGSNEFSLDRETAIQTVASSLEPDSVIVSHVDHSEHDVNIIVTEQGVADLRGKSPKERAQAIIENCVHPDYKNILWDYLKLTDGKAQTPHAVRAALAMHAELAKSGDMKNVDWGQYK